METIQELLASISPTGFDYLTFFKFLLIVGAGLAVLALFVRLIGGKRTGINQAISSAIGIIMIYLISVVLFSIGSPYDQLVSPLPFITFAGEYVTIYSLQSGDFPEICHQIVRLILLSFFVNLLDSVIPKGKKFFGWLFLRCISVILAMIGQWLIGWVFDAILPDFLLTYAPIIILALIALLLAVSVFKLLVGTILGATLGPFVGAIYTFFFSNIVGKQIFKAALTTAILTGLVALLHYFGFGLLFLTPNAFISLIPALLVLIPVWFLLFKLI